MLRLMEEKNQKKGFPDAEFRFHIDRVLSISVQRELFSASKSSSQAPQQYHTYIQDYITSTFPIRRIVPLSCGHPNAVMASILAFAPRATLLSAQHVLTLYDSYTEEHGFPLERYGVSNILGVRKENPVSCA